MTTNNNCPYDLSSFINTTTHNTRIGATAKYEAYVRVSPVTDANPLGQVFLNMSNDVYELVCCSIPDCERFSFLVNEEARIFALQGNPTGSKIAHTGTQAKRGTRREMSISGSRQIIKRIYGNNAMSIFLTAEYYDGCVIFRPTGEIKYRKSKEKSA